MITWSRTRIDAKRASGPAVTGTLTAFTMAGLVAVAVCLTAQEQIARPADQTARPGEDQGFRFRSGVELINVTATVSDGSGRFVEGLLQEDFSVFEDDQPVTVTHFNAERVPVSLGIALDTSGSMAGEKIRAAENALDRFLYDLLDPTDEIFLYRFSNAPTLLQGWTTDRALLTRALSRITASGGTAMYDTVAEAIPLAQQGQNRKKALLVISDGRDTASRTSVFETKKTIRESEALVYAIGIDCANPGGSYRRPSFQRRPPIPMPFPVPGGRRGWPPTVPPQMPPPYRNDFRRCDDPVDVAALRDLTDDSGGRTEIIRQAHDLDPATAGIANELSKQYYLGYPAPGKKDGRWHSIRVEVRNKLYRVRARRGYVAS
jgi:Ca-activated chloride channel family protein